MEAGRVNWNDDRLDRLADEVVELRRHMDARFDRLQIAMIVTLGGILAAFGGLLASAQF
jgi:hypothetical protein